MGEINEIDVTTVFTPYDFGATGAKAILQNVRMILATEAYSCPLNREFAWSPAVDDPINVAQAKISQRLVAAIRRYEPRAKVTQIIFKGDNDGLLKPIVRVKIDDSAAI